MVALACGNGREVCHRSRITTHERVHAQEFEACNSEVVADERLACGAQVVPPTVAGSVAGSGDEQRGRGGQTCHEAMHVARVVDAAVGLGTAGDERGIWTLHRKRGRVVGHHLDREVLPESGLPNHSKR